MKLSLFLLTVVIAFFTMTSSDVFAQTIELNEREKLQLRKLDKSFEDYWEIYKKGGVIQVKDDSVLLHIGTSGFLAESKDGVRYARIPDLIWIGKRRNSSFELYFNNFAFAGLALLFQKGKVSDLKGLGIKFEKHDERIFCWHKLHHFNGREGPAVTTIDAVLDVINNKLVSHKEWRY